MQEQSCIANLTKSVNTLGRGQYRAKPQLPFNKRLCSNIPRIYIWEDNVESVTTIPKGSKTQEGLKCEGTCKCGKEIFRGSECYTCYYHRYNTRRARNQFGSLKFPACVECGTTSKFHQGKGLCAGCYSRQYKKGRSEHMAYLERKSYHKNKEKISLKRKERRRTDLSYREKLNFRHKLARYDGNWITCLERDKYTCQSCGYNTHKKVLEVHHKNKNRKDHALSNLITLCPTCHKEIHTSLRDSLSLQVTVREHTESVCS